MILSGASKQNLRALLFRTIPILCVLIGIIFALSIPFNRDAQAELFSGALREAHVNETVSIRGIVYQVSLGIVSPETGSVAEAAEIAALRLAYEKAAARNNPLLALPGVDIETFRDEIVSLRSTASALAARQSNDNQIFFVQHSLYPTEFLEQLLNLEIARRQFLEHGSDVDAKQYRLQLLSTIDTYRRDRKAFTYAFERVVPPVALSYGTLRSIISRDDFLRVLERLGDDARETEQTARDRTACFQGKFQRCHRTEIILPEFRTLSVAPVSAGALAYAERIRDIFVQSGDRFISSPLILLPGSACAPTDPGTAPLFALRDNGNGAVPSPVFVGNMVFIESAPHAQLPFYGYFASHQVPYVYVHPLSYYECAGARADQGAILATQSVRDFALRERLSARAVGELAAKLKHSENLFASAHVIATTDAERYLRDARALSESPGLPESLSNDIRSLWLRLHTGSDGIFLTVHDINAYESINMGFPSEADLDFDAAYLFFARSGFLSLTPSTFRPVSIDGGALFPANTLPADAQPYVLLSALPDDPATAAEVLSDMRFYRALHPIRN